MDGGAAWADGIAAAAGDARAWLGLSWTREAVLLRLTAIAAWTAGALLAAGVMPRTVARASAFLDTSRARIVAAGLLFHASAFLGVLLLAPRLHAPLAATLLAAMLVVVAVARSAGLAGAFTWAGEMMLARRGGASAYAHLATGALAAGAFALVPVAGPVAWLLLASLGTGAVLATARRG